MSNFVCPLPNGHYRDPVDCRVFYHCLHDIPYRGNCRRHHAFNVDNLTCVPREKVPGCEGQGDLGHQRDEGLMRTSRMLGGDGGGGGGGRKKQQEMGAGKSGDGE